MIIGQYVMRKFSCQMHTLYCVSRKNLIRCAHKRKVAKVEMKQVNEIIRNRRQALGLTLIDVANHLGVKEATAQRYESGEIKNIKHETIVSLAQILKCSPAFLMGWEKEPSNTLNLADQQLVRKYNALDEKGKHTVNTVLNIEYDRCTTPSQELRAAHIDDSSDEQMNLLKQDLDEL